MNRLLGLIAATLMFTTSAMASESPVYTGLLSNTGAGGYDTVSYFETGQPTKGSGDYTAEYQGATWRFANSENLARFKDNPERYAPAYGGYCAWAVSEGYLAKGDPKHWSIREGRLYLNYNQSVQDQWLENPDGFIRQADVKLAEGSGVVTVFNSMNFSLQSPIPRAGLFKFSPSARAIEGQLTSKRLSIYLVRYPEGHKVVPHVDMVSEGRLYKLNCVLVRPKAGGEFICEKNVFNLFGRVILFRPDLYQHRVSKIERGNRWLISFALTQS